MGNVIVLETTEHMNNGVRVADVGQKLVAQPLAFRGTFHQSGDIDDLDSGGNHPLGIVDLREPNEPLVGNGDDAHVGLDRTERKIRRLRLALDRQLKRVDLPTLGSPTIPHCKAIEYLSFLILSVRQASAKCRCPREDGRYTVVRKCKDTNKPRAKANLFAFCPGEVF